MIIVSRHAVFSFFCPMGKRQIPAANIMLDNGSFKELRFSKMINHQTTGSEGDSGGFSYSQNNTTDKDQFASSREINK